MKEPNSIGLTPNAEYAVVDIRKLRDYCLNFEHSTDKHKARLFQSTLIRYLKSYLFTFKFSILPPPATQIWGRRTTESPPILGDLGGVSVITETSQTTSKYDG